MPRERLPDRRGAEVVDFIHRNRRWTATIGRFPDGRVAELFLDAARIDPLSELAQDIAIVASLALQSGCPLETLRHALAGRGEGPLAVALNLIGESGDAA
jgi:ribonucleoside-diphosphate reductase alpha chain